MTHQEELVRLHGRHGDGCGARIHFAEDPADGVQHRMDERKDRCDA
jgi:hypothetical protein